MWGKSFKIFLGIAIILFGLALILFAYDNPLVWLVPIAGLFYIIYINRQFFTPDPNYIPSPYFKYLIEIFYVVGIIGFLISFIPYSTMQLGEGLGIILAYLFMFSSFFLAFTTFIYLFYRGNIVLAQIGVAVLILTVLLTYKSLVIYDNPTWSPLLLILGLLAVIFKKNLSYYYLYVFLGVVYFYFFFLDKIIYLNL